MNGARAVGLTVMVLGVTLLIGTALVDLPGLRSHRGYAPKITGVCYVVAFAAIVGGAWLFGQSS